MIRNYLEFAVRNLLKSKTFDFINVLDIVIESAVANPVDSFKYE